MQLQRRCWNYISLPSSLSRLFAWKEEPPEHSHLYCSQHFDFNNNQLTEIFLYGEEDLDNINNTSILDATINYLIETKRFNAQLFWWTPDVMALALMLHWIFCSFFLWCVFSIFIFLLFVRCIFLIFYMYIFLLPGNHNIYRYAWWL